MYLEKLYDKSLKSFILCQSFKTEVYLN